MTNHSETTGSAGSFENGDIAGRVGPDGHGGRDPDTRRTRREGRDGRAADAGRPLRDVPSTAHQVTLRTPGELADALPYLLGYRPEDSMVLVALHEEGGRGRFGGRARLGIPVSAEDWDAAARQLAQGLVKGSERRGTRPAQMVAYVCREPADGGSGRQVMERLRPLAQLLRTECGRLDIPVIEAVCISAGRFWSYCCEQEACCPSEGTPMGLPGTSVMAAAAAYAGVRVRGTLSELRSRLMPWEGASAADQERALDAAALTLVPRIVDDAARADVARETLALAERLVNRLAATPPVSGTLPADLRDDELLAHDEAAALVLGLQDRTTRDRAAEWMEGEEAPPALRLWRALARRCVASYGEHAAAPLTLAGWVAWSTGDDIEAREAFTMALAADPDYLFARLLHQACNEGLDPESVRRCLRTERAGHTAPDGADGAADGSSQEPGRAEHGERTPDGPEAAGGIGTGPRTAATARSCADPDTGFLARHGRLARRRADDPVPRPRALRAVGRRTRRAPLGGHARPGTAGPGAQRPRTAGRDDLHRAGTGTGGAGRRTAAEPDGSRPASGNDGTEGEV
ncbi:DUF4192 domain-containing protein [Streptomyces sp. NPDC047000]|uniref:DUF4192 domain-containing protein n=1 Tax=Streptomyces sp. NPDC047000 TaxID=3155474 RepID=UPI0033C431F6